MDNLIQSLLNTHDNLDEIIRDPKGRVFISEWNCVNPYADQYIGNLNKIEIPPERETEYVYFKDDYYLSAMISEFHLQRGEQKYSRDEIIPGAGSTPLIASFCLWMVKNNIKEFFYIPPLYYTFYYFSNLYGIRAKPISSDHALFSGGKIRLPSTKSLLIICDPIWYAGKSYQYRLIDKIRDWQIKTQSTVFVDGSFQYTKWSCKSDERTSVLDKKLTFRLVCPTKAIGVHGYRFSYLLMPEEEKEEYIYLYDNITGATPLRNLLFSHQAMKILLEEKSNRELLLHIESNYKQLKKYNIIEPVTNPDCGYFIFAKIKSTNNKHIAMGDSFFDLSGFPDHVRINLIGPGVIDYLSSTKTQTVAP